MPEILFMAIAGRTPLFLLRLIDMFSSVKGKPVMQKLVKAHLIIRAEASKGKRKGKPVNFLTI